MLIVLPPSESKAAGGDGAPLDLEQLSFPSLTAVRKELVEALSALTVAETMAALGLSERLRADAESNSRLTSSPTMPAIRRYTGVLFDALDVDTLSDTSRLAVGSALFGVVRANDPIPRYRLSGGHKLSGRTLKSWWGTEISDALTGEDELIVDLRSGAYQQLGKVRSAVTVRVESVRDDGSRKVVSHFNKHYKGLLARKLALQEADAADAAGVAELARAAGFTVEYPGGQELTLVV